MSPTNLNTLQILAIIALLCIGAFVISAEAEHRDRSAVEPMGEEDQAIVTLVLVFSVLIFGILMWIFWT